MTRERSGSKHLDALWDRTSGVDRRPVIFLLVLPLVVFVLPALFGHPAVTGDNQIQNYPLRVLSGQMLRDGHLPLWDPWIWSGTPLLGGLNAGALYPGILLYTVLPGLVAWTANLVVVYWVAAIGAYVLGRMYGLRPLACVIGAASFAFVGSMTAQMVHLGVVQGAAWMPWIVAGELRLAQIFLPGAATQAREPLGVQTWRASMPWVLLTGGAGGLVFLAGEPRSMADAAWVAALAALWWVTRSKRTDSSRMRRASFLLAVGCSAALGLALGAAQLLPGVRYLQTTERSTASLWYFGSGSLPPRWSVLLLVPDIFGGDGILHQPRFFASYNLPEVTGYVGLLACVAAFTLLARSVGRARSPLARTWSLWIVVVVVGLLLSFGTFTPLGGPLSHIPFYGGMRLQSRNLTIVDFGLAMLLAFWVDTRLREKTARGDESAAEYRTRWYDVVGLAPAFCAAALCFALLVAPSRIETAFGLTASQALSARGLWPWMLLQLVVALAVIVVVIRWPLIRPKNAGRWLIAVVGSDLLLFSVACSTGFVTGGGVPLLPVAADAALLGTGRFAIYDPLVENLPGLIKVGETDLNALTRQSSVQGYGSAVDEIYNDATDTHLDGAFSPCALESGTFASLGLRTLLAISGSVAPRIVAGLSPAPESAGCGIDWPARDATGRKWLFESTEEIDQVDLSMPPGVAAASSGSGGLRVGVVDASGAVVWPVISARSHDPTGLSVQFAGSVQATGLVVSGAGAGQIEDTSTVRGPLTSITLDGPLQDALDRGGWRYAGRVAGFARYTLDLPAPTVWIQGGGAGATVSRSSTTDEGGETDYVVSDRPVVVARSEAFGPGWKVEVLEPSTGATKTVQVKRSGVVQAVDLPAGRFRIVWSYWPPGLNSGLAASAAGTLVVLAGVLFLIECRRRDVRRRAQSVQGSGRSVSSP
jgi:hypothetical protein